MDDHSYEELRAVVLDLLAGRERASYQLDQYESLLVSVGEVLERREPVKPASNRGGTVHTFGGSNAKLSRSDKHLMLEVFWSLFREGIVTLGLDDSNREFPFFHLSTYGKQILDNEDAYFFHDVSTYEALIRKEVSSIDEVTIVYLKEAMQSFRVGCVLSSSVMIGVAAEHTFNLMMEAVQQGKHSSQFTGVVKERGLLRQVNKFKNILDQNAKSLSADVREDLDTRFAGILSVIRTFRNESGHPTGKIVDREQAYVNLQLFIPFCKKMYQLIEHFES